MTTATATKSESNLLFLKMAIAMKELDKPAAQRCLKALKVEQGSEAGSLAERLGVLSGSARLRVQTKVTRRQAKTPARAAKTKSDGKVKARTKSDGKVKARTKSDGKVKARKGVARRARRGQAPRPRRRGSVAPLVAVVVLAGSLLGLGVMSAISSDRTSSNDVALGPAPVAPVEPVAVAPAETKTRSGANAKTEVSPRALDFAISTSAKMQELGKEKIALELLDEFMVAHGDVRRAVEAREALMRRCDEVVDAAGAQAKRLVKQGEQGQAAYVLANLRGRLPASLLPRINALALEVRQSEQAQPKVERRLARADVVRGDEEADDETTAAAVKEEVDDAGGEVAVAAKPERKPAVAAAPKALEKVTPTPAPAVDEDEDEDEDDDDGEDPGMAFDTDSPVALALAEVVSVPYKLRKNGEFSVHYSFQQSGELEDFQSLGFDKFDVNTSDGVSFVSRTGLDVGAGSQRLARWRHAVVLEGDFEVEVELRFSFSNSRTQMVLLIGKKIGVNFGQQLVRVNKRGKMTKALSGRAERNAFSHERLVKVKLTSKDGVLEVRCNGRKTASKRFKANELRGPFGMVAKDVRLQITSLSIRGQIDTGEL